MKCPPALTTIFLILIASSLNARLLNASDAEVVPTADSTEQPASTSPIDFARDIQPVLKQNCMACHHAKEDEGGLSMETVKSMLAGGDSGAGIVAKDIESSLIFARASGAEEPMMPPEDNSVGARPLTPDELKSLRQWIMEGAKASDGSTVESIEWQAIPDSIRSIYATDQSPSGKAIAVAQANRVLIFDAQSGKQTDTLVDPNLSQQAVADVDMIQAITFDPLGQTIATGGFRTLRLWSRSEQPSVDWKSLDAAESHVTPSPDRSLIALVNSLGEIEIWDRETSSLRHTLAAHELPVTSIVWLSNEQLASSDAGGTVSVHQSTDGKLMQSVEHATPLRGLVASGDGKWLAAINDVDLAVVLSAADLSLVRTQEAIPAVRSLAFTGPQQSQLAIGAGNQVHLLQPSDGVEKLKLDQGTLALSLASAPDGVTLAVGGKDGKTRLWNTGDGKLTATAQGNSASLQQLAIVNRDVERFQSTVARMEKATETLTAELKKEDEALAKVTETHKTATEELKAEAKKLADAETLLKTTEQTLATATQTLKQSEATTASTQKMLAEAEAAIAKTTMELTEVTKQADSAKANLEKAQKELEEAERKAKEAQAVAEQAAKVAAAKQQQLEASKKTADEAKAKLAMLAKSKEEAAKTIEKSKPQIEQQQKTVAAAMEAKTKKEETVAKRLQALETARQSRQRAADAIPAQKTLIASVKRRLQATEKTLEQLQQHQRFGSPIVAVAASPDGQSIAAVAADGWIRTYRISDGLPLVEFPPTGKNSSAVPQGCVFLNSSHCWIDGAQRAVNLSKRWRLAKTIGGLDSALISDRVTAIDFDSSGELLAIGSGAPSRSGQVLILSARTGRVLHRLDDLHSDTVLAVRFSPDGQTLASGGADKSIRLVNVRDGELIRSLDGHTHHILGVDWMDDGQSLVSCSADKTVKIWNVETGQQKRTISGFGDEVTSIQAIPKTTRVATSSADGQVRIHDINNGGQVRAISTGDDFLFSVSISPDGGQAVSGGQNGVPKQWDIDNGKPIRDLQP